MKRKGITVWEQYIERIVLGIALLFFLGIVGWQIVTDPNVVSEGGRTISPGEIDELVQTRAIELNVRLEPSAPSPIQIPEYEPILGDFLAMLAAPVSHTDRIAGMQRETRFADFDVSPAELALYHVPVPPAPSVLAPRQFYDAVQADVVENYPALAAHFPAATHDGTWVVPSAVLDLVAVRSAYETSTGEHAQLPANFYEGRLDVLYVAVERMRRAEGGAWSDLTRVNVPPGMLTFEPRLQGEVSKGLRDEVLGELRRTGAQLEVLRPSFYPTRAGAFVPPSAGEAAEEIPAISDEERDIRRSRARLRDLISRRTQLEEQIRRLGGDPSTPTPPSSPAQPGGTGPGTPSGPAGPARPGGAGGDGDRRQAPPGGGGGMAPGGGGGFGDPAGGGGSGGAAPGRGGEGQTGQAARIATLRAQLERLIVRLEREQSRLESLTGRRVDMAAQAADVTPIDLMSADELVIWAHDVDVLPGETYRYRFTVHYYNPFFARRLDLLPEQHGLADAIALASMQSEWSPPIEVELPQRVFVAEANVTSGESGFGEAVVEVFRFQDGRWWRESFRVEPGMQIGGMRRVRGAGEGNQNVDVDFATEWFLLDVVPDLDADRETVERGRGARAVLQRISGTGQLVLDPRQTAVDPVREWLYWSVEDANREPSVAMGQPQP